MIPTREIEIQLTGADLMFVPETHEYRLPLSGVVVPSVTQILKAVGVSVDFDALKQMGGARAEAIERKRAIGTAVHADAHAYDDDDLDWTTVHPDVLPYLQAWVSFRKQTGFIPTTRERIVYSPTLGVCGTLDAIGHFAERPDARVLCDMKCGDPADAACALQTALYQILWEEEHPNEPIAERIGVELTPDRKIPYRLHAYTDWTDFQVARACVTVYHNQAARRQR